jgi:hypothetical protein
LNGKTELLIVPGRLRGFNLICLTAIALLFGVRRFFKQRGQPL